MKVDIYKKSADFPYAELKTPVPKKSKDLIIAEELSESESCLETDNESPTAKDNETEKIDEFKEEDSDGDGKKEGNFETTRKLKEDEVIEQ